MNSHTLEVCQILCSWGIGNTVCVRGSKEQNIHVLCVSPLLMCMFCCPIRFHTRSEVKSLRISSWQQQSIKPSRGHIPMKLALCAAFCICRALSLTSPLFLCSLGWPGMVARGGRKCGQPIQPHLSLLPPSNSQTELSSFPQQALLSSIIVSSTPVVLRVVTPGPAASASLGVVRKMQIPGPHSRPAFLGGAEESVSTFPGTIVMHHCSS